MLSVYSCPIKKQQLGSFTQRLRFKDDSPDAISSVENALAYQKKFCRIIQKQHILMFYV